MQEISLSSINHCDKTSNFKFAQSISTFCPFCHERVNFNAYNHVEDIYHKTISHSSDCPACRRIISFWTVSIEGDEVIVYMFPECMGYRKVLFTTSEIPDPIKRSYESTVNAFDSKNYTATAVCCRRTLEGIFKYRLPDGKKNLPLARAIDETKSSEDLAKPLNNLSHAIRQGGNLGAHFDMEYLYTLPNQIERIDNVLGNES
jgi:Domain of unknown function (DUF4145)